MADAKDSKSFMGNHVWVQVPPSAPKFLVKLVEIRVRLFFLLYLKKLRKLLFIIYYEHNEMSNNRRSMSYYLKTRNTTKHEYYKDCYDYYDESSFLRYDDEKSILVPITIRDNDRVLPDMKYVDKSLLKALFNIDIQKEYSEISKHDDIKIEGFENFVIYFNNVIEFFKQQLKEQENYCECENCPTL